MTVEATSPRRVEPDRARERYEQLRELYLHGSCENAGPIAERMAVLGFVGLFDRDSPRVYVAELHEARARGWGRADPHDAALRDVARLLLGAGGLVVPLLSSTGEERRIGS